MRRNSAQIGNRGDDDEQTQILDLPSPIVVDILLLLSVKTILVCKCVSKAWRSLISDPQFAKLHFSRQQPCPLIRTLNSTHVSRMLNLIEPETCHNFDIGYCSCNGGNQYDQCGLHVNMKLDSKLKIPLRNAEMVLNGEEGDAQMGCSSEGSGVKRKCCIKVKPKPKDQKYEIVNSCNGFLCLSEPSRNDPVVVCNPVTGEYINLPVVNRADEKTKYFVDCGFGFSPKANQYKVIRMFQQLFRDPVTGWERYRSTEINTLGTGSWRSIGDSPFSTYRLTFPTYLKGCIHWFCFAIKSSNYIVSFNFDDEQFKWVPPPPPREFVEFVYNEFHETDMVNLSAMCNVSMGVIKDCLCISDASGDCSINIWVMKKYGVQESWTKMFSIDTDAGERWWPFGLYQPINYLKNGTLLMFQYLTNSLICYGPKGSQELKYLKRCGNKSTFEAIAYIPSFISLKEAVGDNMVVLNINSRCAKFEVLGETEAISLEEEDMDMASDSFSSYSVTDERKRLWQR